MSNPKHDITVSDKVFVSAEDDTFYEERGIVIDIIENNSNNEIIAVVRFDTAVEMQNNRSVSAMSFPIQSLTKDN